MKKRTYDFNNYNSKIVYICRYNSRTMENTIRTSKKKVIDTMNRAINPKVYAYGFLKK